MNVPAGIRQIAGIGLAILICLLPGAIGSIFTSSAIDSWYREIEKPWFNPPSWVFGPVWTALYIGMGIALYLIWRNRDGSTYWVLLLMVYAAQLLLNTLWSLAFFGLESPGAGIVVILPLWTLILVTILMARRYSIVAAALLVPYLLWVSFATILNVEIWRLN